METPITKITQKTRNTIFWFLVILAVLRLAVSLWLQLSIGRFNFHPESLQSMLQKLSSLNVTIIHAMSLIFIAALFKPIKSLTVQKVFFYVLLACLTLSMSFGLFPFIDAIKSAFVTEGNKFIYVSRVVATLTTLTLSVAILIYVSKLEPLNETTSRKKTISVVIVSIFAALIFLSIVYGPQMFAAMLFGSAMGRGAM